jgi:methionyl-tRNA formyltransferase
MEDKNKKIRIIFAGTPNFAVPYFNALLSATDFEITGVITQPDKPSGRKQELTPSPVKQTATASEIKILQPEKLTGNQEIIGEIKNLNPDLLIVVAYGLIIPKPLLDLFPRGAINVHPSLLPSYRGASPIQSAILNGEKTTGISIMLMDEKMDHGPLLKQVEVPLTGEETNESLHDQLAVMGAPLLLETVKEYLAGKITPAEQDHNQATFCRTISKEDAQINWQSSAQEIKQKIYAFYPWPATWTTWNGKRLKLFPPVQVISEQSDIKVGEVFLSDGKLAVKTGADALVINQLQLEGKKEASAEEFLRGYPEIVGAVLK